jgi:hypothetical protein
VRYETTDFTVFDVEPFGHELKAEWLSRNEKFSVVSMLINLRGRKLRISRFFFWGVPECPMFHFCFPIAFELFSNGAGEHERIRKIKI